MRYKIYLDSCCFNRPFDDLSQEKIRLECEAVLTILKYCDEGRWAAYKSDILDDEIDRITDVFKKIKVVMLYAAAVMRIDINDMIIKRAKELQQRAIIKPFDALHLASAEYSGADILLTTDKNFINRAARSDAKINVANPVVWLSEVMFHD